tara:strand:- start:1743 stop:2504 length:762 start_codon:yes stop_codon:yes gene_type:complete
MSFSFFKLFKSFPKKHNALLNAIEKMCDFRPSNYTVYLSAFRQKFENETQKEVNMHYERLEYLGDAILGSLIAQYLYDEYPEGNEGFLTSMRSKVVSRKALNRVAIKLGIPKWIKTNNRNRRLGTTSVPGSALEALVGAIYVDKGWAVAKLFVHQKILNDHINFNQVEKEIVSYKSLLIEWFQSKKKEFSFDVTDENGSDHHKRFSVTIKMDDEPLAKGSGQSKKTAEESASKFACKKLKIKQRGPVSSKRSR